MKTTQTKKLKRLGLIGGTSWHSTIEYYRYINEYVNTFFGDNTNPPLLVYTLNQSLIHKYQIDSNWEGVSELLIEAAKSLQNAGAEALMFCANTPHKVFEKVKQKTSTPIIHIADTVTTAIQKSGISKVCFIGTKFTMEEDFITHRIIKNGITVLVPQERKVIDELHRIIQKELTYGNIIDASKQFVISALQSMMNRGAEGIILGCTEFPLMITSEDLPVPTFNTTQIHSHAAAEYILTDYR